MSLTDLMSHAGLSIYAEMALVLFLVSFVAICWWVYRPANRQRWTSDARLPLDDGQLRTSRQQEN